MAAAAALSRKAARFSRTIAPPSRVLRSGASGSIIFPIMRFDILDIIEDGSNSKVFRHFVYDDRICDAKGSPVRLFGLVPGLS